MVELLRKKSMKENIREMGPALAILLAAVTYLDRVCISRLAQNIMADLDLGEHQMNFVFGAFALAYAAFEIPTARWADRRGTRQLGARRLG
jgi:ACS family glucarate transporter-like MFS transporter